jgi:hypothetical protein
VSRLVFAILNSKAAHMIQNCRRRFLKNCSLATLSAFIPSALIARPARDRIWGNLLHLSFNMWEDWDAPGREMRSYRPYLRFDEALWNDLLEAMASSGLNMVVIDLGDGVQYESHPEIAVKNAWTVDKLSAELIKIRSLGIEPIPKLNFASSHDAWLGEYSRCLSTQTYYRVCADLIAEVIDIFDRPRFFHLGMDEEDTKNQRDYRYMVVRQYDLWWHDFLLLCHEVEKRGVRPWVWSDYYWHYPDRFLARMPKNVLQSNWYYGTKFGSETPVQAYTTLELHGFDQVPTASNHSNDQNFRHTVEYCSVHISDDHLFGFLQTPWRPTIEEYRQHHMQAIEQVGAVIRRQG